jgi:hypothetical protein
MLLSYQLLSYQTRKYTFPGLSGNVMEIYISWFVYRNTDNTKKLRHIHNLFSHCMLNLHCSHKYTTNLENK